jgi:hypothetical protein
VARPSPVLATDRTGDAARLGQSLLLGLARLDTPRGETRSNGKTARKPVTNDRKDPLSRTAALAA